MSVKGSAKKRRAQPLDPEERLLSEKEELADLNKRLELYVLWLREKEADKLNLERDVKDLTKSNHDKDLKIHDLEREIESLQAEVADLKDALAARDERINHYLGRIAQLTSKDGESAALRFQKERLEKEVTELRARNQDLQKQLDAKTADAIGARGELDGLRRENEQLPLLRARVTSLESNLEAAQKRGDDLAKERDRFSKQVRALEEEIEKLRIQVPTLADLRAQAKAPDTPKRALSPSDDGKKYLKVIHDLEQKLRDQEASLRKEFGTQLREIIRESQDQFEKRISALEEELRGGRDETEESRARIKALEAELEELRDAKAELDRLQAKAAHLEADNARLREGVANLTRQRDDTLEELKRAHDRFAIHSANSDKTIRGLEKERDSGVEEVARLQKLLDDLTRQRDKLAEDLKAQQTLIDRLREQLAAAGRARPPTPTVVFPKVPSLVPLENEIKAYSLLLEAEEARCGEEGYVSPAAEQSTVIIDQVKDRDMLTVRNDGGEEVDLSGWRLQSMVTKKTVDVEPGVVLQPGEYVQVVFGDAKAKGKKPKKCVKRVIQRETILEVNDIVVLFNASHTAVHRRVVGTHAMQPISADEEMES